MISFPPGTEMFQFPGSPRAFRDRRSLGSSPGLFAAFHARILMTPRHPPRALRSLTTPIGPPRLWEGTRADAAGSLAVRVSQPRRLATRRPVPDQSLRSVRVRFSSRTSADRSAEAVKLFYGECHSPSRNLPAGLRRPWITRVCVNSTKSRKNGSKSDKMRILSHEDRPSRPG